MAPVEPDRAEAGLFRPLGKERRALHQAVGRAHPATGEERRDRQEEVVHEIGLDEGAEDVRTGLAEDAAVAA